MIESADQMSLFGEEDRDTWCGKMSPEHLAAGRRKEETSPQSLKRRSVSQSQKPPLCLCLKKGGQNPGASTMKWETGQLLGEFTMRSFGESPREENVSRLFAILEVCPPQKYCLSAKACQGILTRARKRGKELPELLRMALEQQVTRSKLGGGCDGGGKGALVQTERSATLSTLQDQTLITAIAIENHPADSRCKFSDGNIVQTLSSRMGTGGNNVPMVMERHRSDVILHDEDISPTLHAAMGMGGNNVPMISAGFKDRAGAEAGIAYSEELAPTLLATMIPAVECLDVGFFSAYVEQAPTQLARQYKDPPVVAVDTVGTLCASGYPDKLTHQDVVSGLYPCQGNIVRRLTPLECERLQGFPDNWTDIGDWTDTKGKVHKMTDSARYKALGNSIALPFWFYLLRRISAQYERPATMGSLFDGIGGFPYCWEKCNGKGTARWASEIEEFPIAVTKIRFPEVR